VPSLPPTRYVSTAPRSHRSSTLFRVLLSTHFRFALSVVLSVALPPLFHLALFAIRQRSGPSRPGDRPGCLNEARLSVPVDSTLVPFLPPTCYVSTAPPFPPFFHRSFTSFFHRSLTSLFHRSFTSFFLQSDNRAALHDVVTGQVVSVRSVSVPVDSTLVPSLPPTCYVSTAPRSHRSSTVFPVLLPTHFRFVLSPRSFCSQTTEWLTGSQDDELLSGTTGPSSHPSQR
jgi:hypothetical protein